MFHGRLKFKIKSEHDSWEYLLEVHALEWVADFYWQNPATPRQIQAAVSISCIVTSLLQGKADLEGGIGVKGHSSLPS